MNIIGKVCVIGAGRWGKNHIRTLYELGELGGVVDSNKKALNEIKEIYPTIPMFLNVSEAINIVKS